jgi:hypothetical protein
MILTAILGMSRRELDGNWTIVREIAGGKTVGPPPIIPDEAVCLTINNKTS